MKIAYGITATLFAASVAAFAATPCCEEQDFRGIGAGVSPAGVKIQLTEVKRISPHDIRVTWTFKNTSKQPQILAKTDGALDNYKLSHGANLIDAAGRVRMKVAKDTGGHILAAEHKPYQRSLIVLDAGQTLTTWAKFVVPETTTAVSVDLPGATMPWENVAVSK
ncbi:MAG: hypothetical protein M3R62_08955 [Acidobacteriota bacterium]|nr:hypothetical protein [Acidobacteriota bacterium]